MRALLTGISSFTGSHFAKALMDEGIDVVASQRTALSARDDPLIHYRLTHLGLIKAVPDHSTTGHGIALHEAGSDFAFKSNSSGKERGSLSLLPVGSLSSAQILQSLDAFGPFDLFCMHGAETRHHNKPCFDWKAAFAANTNGVASILARLHELDCRQLLMTGTVFGAKQALPAGNAYGLSKTLTNDVWRFEANCLGWSTREFKIAHPFGVGEKPGLTTHLMQSWLRHEVPNLKQPYLTRDFTPIDALAKAYGQHARDGVVGDVAPSRFIESNAAFAGRMAETIRPLSGLQCDFTWDRHPTPQGEPESLYNSNKLTKIVHQYDEKAMWQDYLNFHKRMKSLSIYS